MNDGLVLKIEQLVLGAWPAAEVVELDGWRLRFAAGVTGRANSVWPNGGNGRFSLSEKIAQAAAFYRQRHLPPRYQISPAAQPPELDAALAAQGYALLSPTRVQTAVLTPLATANPALVVTLTPQPAANWLALHQQLNDFDDQTLAVRRAIMERPTAPTAFVLAAHGGRPVGLGMGVCQGEWLAIFSMGTRPEVRRQGVATAVLGALFQWALAQGATRSYLQVVKDNHGAQALYRQHGYQTAYAYHYRLKRDE